MNTIQEVFSLAIGERLRIVRDEAGITVTLSVCDKHFAIALTPEDETSADISDVVRFLRRRLARLQ